MIFTGNENGDLKCGKIQANQSGYFCKNGLNGFSTFCYS